MKSSYVIAMDIHSYSTHVLVQTPTGKTRFEQSLPTELKDIVPVIERVPRRRCVVMEAGPLSGWLYRNLQPYCDEVVVSETRRNAFIAREGNKSDAIDARKLAQLYRGGFLRGVHHATDEKRAGFKELVLFYHRCVGHRVAASNRVVWALREHGIKVRGKAFKKIADREVLREEVAARPVISMRLRMLLDEYDLAAEHEQAARNELTRLSKCDEMIKRLMEVPGVGVIWASTFSALIDTPFRFKRKSKLWRYMGIGLQQRSSGRGYVSVGLGCSYNRLLKNMIMSAAQTAVRLREEHVFTEQYRRLLDRGVVRRSALRTVARSMAAVMWGMMKSQTSFCAEQVKVGCEH